MTKLQHGAILECKWEAFKEVIFTCTKGCFLTNDIHVANMFGRALSYLYFFLVIVGHHYVTLH